jgi:hypothetical protein
MKDKIISKYHSLILLIPFLLALIFLPRSVLSYLQRVTTGRRFHITGRLFRCWNILNRRECFQRLCVHCWTALQFMLWLHWQGISCFQKQSSRHYWSAGPFFSADDYTCIYFYVLPALLNLIFVLYWMRMDGMWDRHKPFSIRRGVFLMLIYLTAQVRIYLLRELHLSNEGR